ncbi:hypothetical protein OBBRIDRAFT_128728 [Obba rivulosa]|uniref:DUF6533 domain-containing protein n=1 Tax=Obba rivulosa TaxID=1052685 RepID=A0A8E2ARA2_9APHY|nr:hypothetical protein OBBRIDRAFT_128728 [Obba rivulosa]
MFHSGKRVMSALAEDKAAIADILFKAHLVEYVFVASLAAAIYDYFLTMGDEVSLVWPSRWSLMKVLFLLNRYLVFVDTAIAVQTSINLFSNLEECDAEHRVFICIYVMGIGIVELIIGIRTYAVWRCSKRILCLLVTVYLSGFAGVLFLLNRFVQIETFPSPTLMRHESCTANITIAQAPWPAYIFMVLMESVVILLTLIHCHVSTSPCSKLPQVSPLAQSPRFSPLDEVLRRDGIMFYFTMLGMSITNISLILAGPAALSSMMQMPLRVVHSLLCSRMILNIRNAVLERQITRFPALSVRFATESYLGLEDMGLPNFCDYEAA